MRRRHFLGVAGAIMALPIDQGTANNTVFSHLQVWRDLDSDGETDTGKLFSLTDGSTIKAGDVVLDISQVSTEYLGATTVSAAAAALPELRGFGTVADLRIAMSEDAGLLNQVQAFDALTTTDLSVLKAENDDLPNRKAA